jgi:hypothetical protein
VFSYKERTYAADKKSKRMNDKICLMMMFDIKEIYLQSS